MVAVTQTNSETSAFGLDRVFCSVLQAAASRRQDPGMILYRDRAQDLVECSNLLEHPATLRSILENLREGMIIELERTDNRIRSPR